MNKRAGHSNWGAGAERRITTDANWRNPIKWNRQAEAVAEPTKVFCASMADVFDGEVGAHIRNRLWELIRETPNLDWQLLSKRPANFRRFLPKDWGQGYKNVWLGVTAENRNEALRRIPLLQSTPAAVRFVSAEPLLEDLGELDLTAIDWVIIGGESGGKARPFDVAWAEGLIKQSEQQGASVFMKQLGRRPSFNGNELVVLDGNGRRDGHAGDPDFWPEQLRDLAVRQFPASVLVSSRTS
jgi:protein gp37